MPILKKKGYNTNVFINCPFDAAYKPIFDAIVFAIYDCGFRPRCALEESDSADVRISKLIDLISACRYGVHDISRTELDSSTGLPRFNMPLELGLFLGCLRFGGDTHKSKKCLILDTTPYRYQKFISDIAGQDIQSHEGSAAKAVSRLRDWLRNASRRTTVPGGGAVWHRYSKFSDDLPEICIRLGLGPTELTFLDYCHTVEEWLEVTT